MNQGGTKMSRLNISIKNGASINTLHFNKYLESGSWQCPVGGAHIWVEIKDNQWRCRKCHATREFKCPDYIWNDILRCALPWSMYREFNSRRAYRGV